MKVTETKTALLPTQKKGLKQYEGEQMMTSFYLYIYIYLGELSL